MHTELIAKAGIDGFAIQRFVDKDLENRNSLFLHKNRTAELIKASAEKWGTKFYLQYDTSGSPDNWVTAIKNDFNEVIKDHLKLLESPNYARQNGKIVVCLWGPGFTDRPGTAAEAAALIQWFKTEHDAFVIGGVPTNWRTSNSDSKPNWQNTYLSYDSIEPWSVGRFNNDASAQSFYSNYVAKDLKYLQEMNNLLKKNIQYKTIIWPGFSWHNMNRANGKSTPFNQVPRRGGQFLWKQAQLAATRGIKTYVAMFDEFDEGTAIAPAANSKSLIPPGTTFLTLDADGLQMSSDFYVRLTGEITQMLRTSSARSSFSTGLQGPVLRLDSRGSESPVIKSDFNLSWSFSGPDSTQPFCWAISEDADPHTWNDNFLCADKDLKLRWSPAGPIEGLYCTKVDEPSDPHTWSDNYLCSELDLKLQWSYAGPIPGLKCLLVNEPSDPDAWTDNFLCHPEN